MQYVDINGHIYNACVLEAIDPIIIQLSSNSFRDIISTRVHHFENVHLPFSNSWLRPLRITPIIRHVAPQN